jgi:hypothetical protein
MKGYEIHLSTTNGGPTYSSTSILSNSDTGI